MINWGQYNKRTDKLDTEGKKNTEDIIAIKKDVGFTADAVKEIRVEQKAMRAEQKSDFGKLLKAIQAK